MFAFASPSSLYARTVFASGAMLRPTCATQRYLPLNVSRSRPASITSLGAVTAKASPPSQAPVNRRMPGVLRPVVPTSDLLAFDVPDKAQQRSDIVRQINVYIKQHDLQDPNNRRVVLCDNKLKKLLGVDTCTLFEINAYIKPYIRRPEDVGQPYEKQAQEIERVYFEKKDLERDTGAPKKVRQPSPKARVFKPCVLSEELATVCCAKEMPRPEVLKSVWAYIRLNNLQGASGEPIKCDFLLQKLFKANEINPRSVMKALAPHINPKKQ